ncbi:hypothetical protein E2C01_062627 [Portunus trituberculatus]|uniref:Uncharacterized protein n=1 Tax=Portunus trituberculatus TaxID=210409 RepID=A0A5B7HEJ4_PORTR|nr:hypothetical protein [Portunus trituberculatus]
MHDFLHSTLATARPQEARSGSPLSFRATRCSYSAGDAIYPPLLGDISWCEALRAGHSPSSSHSFS